MKGSYIQRASQAFEGFVALANKLDIHPSDWRRFYSWVRLLHPRTRAKMTGHDVKRMLMEHGFSDHQATEAGFVFHHLKGFLGP
jgi:hypothetical protein